MWPVVVIGAGAAGLAAALEVARWGYQVLVVEKEKQLGGWAGRYACKATDVCQKCGACMVSMLEAKVKDEKGIELWLQWQVITIKRRLMPVRELVSVKESLAAAAAPMYIPAAPLDPQGTWGGQLPWEISLQRSEQVPRGAEGLEKKIMAQSVNASAIILATGFSPFAAEEWPEYGYRRYPGVITSLDLEELWAREGSFAHERGKGRWERVAFVQCVGSRTRRGGNPACSRVCCSYALRMVERLRYELPQAQIDIFYLDFQVGYDTFSALSNAAGIRMIRAFPSRFYQLPGQKVVVGWEDSATGRQQEERYDRVILSVGMTGNLLLAKMLSLLEGKIERDLVGELGNHAGFIASRSLQEALAAEGIFCAGACKGPATIRESINDGRKAALQAVSYLSSWR